MSFIRCTSNPEGLYVYGCVGGTTCWSTRKDNIHIPNSIWIRFIKSIPRWNADHKRGCLEIKEVYIRHKKKQSATDKEFLWHRGNYKYVLYYRGKEVTRMWTTTWKYIYNNMIATYEHEKNKKQKK